MDFYLSTSPHHCPKCIASKLNPGKTYLFCMQIYRNGKKFPFLFAWNRKMQKPHYGDVVTSSHELQQQQPTAMCYSEPSCLATFVPCGYEFLLALFGWRFFLNITLYVDYMQGNCIPFTRCICERFPLRLHRQCLLIESVRKHGLLNRIRFLVHLCTWHTHAASLSRRFIFLRVGSKFTIWGDNCTVFRYGEKKWVRVANADMSSV